MSAKWTAADVPDQSGRVAIVTGSNTGLGYEPRPCWPPRARTSCWPCATSTRATTPRRASPAASPDAVVTVQELDLTSLDNIRTAADELRAAHPRIDLLINNAGVMYTAKADHQGRLRAAVRHQPPRPLRAHRSAAGQHAARGGLAGGDGQQRRPPHPGPNPLRRPAVGAQLRPRRRLRPVQAGQPAVHLRTGSAG